MSSTKKDSLQRIDESNIGYIENSLSRNCTSIWNWIHYRELDSKPERYIWRIAELHSYIIFHKFIYALCKIKNNNFAKHSRFTLSRLTDVQICQLSIKLLRKHPVPYLDPQYHYSIVHCRFRKDKKKKRKKGEKNI